MTLENRVPMTLREPFFRDDFFKSAWDDFEKLRQEMMKESDEFWRKVEQDWQMMSSSTGFQPLESSMRDSRPSFFPRRWMLPRLWEDDMDMKMKSFDIFQDTKDEQVVRVRDDDSKFEISLDTSGFRPDELKVNVSGNMLSVEGKHEEKSDGRHVSRQFSRKYSLPPHCEPQRVNSNLSSDGILLITAPKVPAIRGGDDAGRIVPIVKR